MAIVVHKSTLQVRRSVHTCDYIGKKDWLINPELPDVLQRYWKFKDGKVVEMDAAEKRAIDDVIAVQRLAEKERLLRARKIRKRAILLATKALVVAGEMTSEEAIQAAKEEIFGSA